MTKTIFIDVKYEGEIKFSEELLDYLKKENIKKIALFASLQFINLASVERQLKESKIAVLKTRASHACKDAQILGCNCYKENFGKDIFESDLIIYVGDGLFHPKALLLSQVGHENFKRVLCFNPVNGKIKILGREDIEPQVKRMKRNLRMFVSARKIGILVSLKSGQEHFNGGLKLKKKLEKEGKKCFIFIDNDFDFSNLDNFNFVEAWVNTACPRIGTDDVLNIEKVIINLADAQDPVKTLERFR